VDPLSSIKNLLMDPSYWYTDIWRRKRFRRDKNMWVTAVREAFSNANLNSNQDVVTALHGVIVGGCSEQIMLAQTQIHEQHCNIAQISSPVFLQEATGRGCMATNMMSNQPARPDPDCRGLSTE
jgi:hypothetical protein